MVPKTHRKGRRASAPPTPGEAAPGGKGGPTAPSEPPSAPQPDLTLPSRRSHLGAARPFWWPGKEGGGGEGGYLEPRGTAPAQGGGRCFASSPTPTGCPGTCGRAAASRRAGTPLPSTAQASGHGELPPLNAGGGSRPPPPAGGSPSGRGQG